MFISDSSNWNPWFKFVYFLVLFFTVYHVSLEAYEPKHAKTCRRPWAGKSILVRTSHLRAGPLDYSNCTAILCRRWASLSRPSSSCVSELTEDKRISSQLKASNSVAIEQSEAQWKAKLYRRLKRSNSGNNTVILQQASKGK